MLSLQTQLLRDVDKNEAMRSELREVRHKLGEPGAVKRVAHLVYNLGKEKCNE